LREKIAALSHDSEASLPDEAFAMVAESEGQPKRRQLPLRNAGEVKAAAAWLEKYRDEFLYPDRRKIADRIFEKAGEFGATLGDHSEFIEKLAGFGTCDAETIAVELEKRAQLIWRKDAEAATEIRNLAAIVRSSPIESRQPHQLEKMATAIDQLDFNYGLNKLYADGLDRPEDALFQITEKVATSFISDHIETTTGSVYELSKLAELSPTAVRNWMGDDFTEAVTGGDGLMLDLEKLATILPTLPRDDAGMFDRMVGSLGVSPVGTVPTGGHQLSQDRLFELAAQRQPVAVG